jgi:hypothetical protein
MTRFVTMKTALLDVDDLPVFVISFEIVSLEASSKLGETRMRETVEGTTRAIEKPLKKALEIKRSVDLAPLVRIGSRAPVSSHNVRGIPE